MPDDEPVPSPQLRAALAALRECNLDELNRIRLFRLPAILRAVALRERAAKMDPTAAKLTVLPPLRVVPADDGEGGLDLKPDPRAAEYVAGAVDGKSVPDDEDDEPDDENATPLEVVGPPDEADVIEARAWFRTDAGHDEPRGPHT